MLIKKLIFMILFSFPIYNTYLCKNTSKFYFVIIVKEISMIFEVGPTFPRCGPYNGQTSDHGGRDRLVHLLKKELSREEILGC